MYESIKKYILVKKGVLIQECLFFVACFFYLLLRIHPVLILELQPPVFLFDTNFFNELLKIPGGMVDWFSALLMTFWLSDFLTSLLLTLCFWIVAFLTKKWIEALTDYCPIHTIHLIPAYLLLILNSQYNFPLSITVALILNLSILNLFVRWAPTGQVVRTVVGAVVSVLLFWMTGGCFLVFVVLCGMCDIMFRKQIVNGLVLLISALALPYVLSASVFLVPLRQAYLHNLIFENPIKFRFIEYAVLVFYLLILFIVYFAKFAIFRKPFKKIAELIRLQRVTYFWKCTGGTILLLCGIILLAQKTNDNNARYVLEVNQFVREGHSQDALKTAMQCSIVNPLLSSQTNIALFQSNALLDKMFMYPQFYGTAGLLMDFEWCSAWPQKASDVFWKLGLVNEALHWAHESFEQNGPTPEILERLGIVYMIKGDHEAARHYFLNLKNLPFKGSIAEKLIELNENPSELAKDTVLSYIQSCMPTESLYSLGGSIPEKLELLLKRNPKNKMAFEYLIAYYLLNCNLEGIMNHLTEIKTFANSRIPRHVQEALLIIKSLKNTFDQNQLENVIQPLTYSRYTDYEQILRKYKGNVTSAKHELQMKFGNTYWYYIMFVRPESRRLEGQNDFQ